VTILNGLVQELAQPSCCPMETAHVVGGHLVLSNNGLNAPSYGREAVTAKRDVGQGRTVQPPLRSASCLGGFSAWLLACPLS
jgi:hypothetical protein